MKRIEPVPRQKKAVLTALILFFTIIVDQIVKYLAYQYLRGQPGHSFLWDTIRLEYAENSGAFLSLGASLDPSMRTLLFVVGVLVIIGFCLVWLIRSPLSHAGVLALSLVIAGGIGNLIDRVSRGSVVDYIFMGIGPLHTGVFNVADIAISGGLVLMLYDQYVTDKALKK